MSAPQDAFPREATVVDADHPRARGVFEFYEQIRQTRSLMGLAGQHGEERINRLYDELHLGVQGMNDGMTTADLASLERKCGILLSYLLETAIRRQERLTNRQRADDDARLHRIEEQLGGLLNPQGLADRLRQRIRRLQENRQQEATLRQQGDDIHDLREALAEMRRDMERGLPPAEPAPAPRQPEPSPHQAEPAPFPRRSEPREVRPPQVDARNLLKSSPRRSFPAPIDECPSGIGGCK
jgi:hypothetical protein